MNVEGIICGIRAINSDKKLGTNYVLKFNSRTRVTNSSFKIKW